MIFNDEKTNTAITGHNQLSHLFQRRNIYDRHHHHQWQGPAGATEAEVENEVQVKFLVK